MDEAITVSDYHEQIRGLVDRRLTLMTDRVHFTGTVRGARIEGAVLLSDLQPTPNRIWVRSKHYHWSLATLAILSPCAIPPFSVFPPNFVLLAVGVVFYIPAIWYFLNSKNRNEYALFHNRSGLLVLDVCRKGPDVARFNEFVAAIEKQISEKSVRPEPPDCRS